ncbi:MAG TPA: hypothetical protein VMW35_00590 [Myxococcota bacterium]|nr:hypothetical protein [Myxococcota bacterium]
MSHGSRARALVETAAVFAIALAVRIPLVRQEYANDEIFHVLAARRFLLDGTFQIHLGEPYVRAEAFTRLVAASFALLGEGPVAARLPALLAGALTAAVAFAWLRASGERLAAWIAGLLVAFDPELVRLSAMCRFYTPQHLVFLLGLVAVGAATAPGRGLAGRALLGAAAALAFHEADTLQEVSRVGLLGIGTFVGLVAIGALLRKKPRPMALAAVGLLALVAAGAIGTWAYRSGFLAENLAAARYVDLWASPAADMPRFYHYWLVDTYPTLWTLFPAAALVALSVRPRVALLCACTFGVGIAVHSALATKAPRYVSYLLPSFLIVSALALSRVAPALERVAERVSAAIPELGARPRPARLSAMTAAAACIVFAIAGNSAFVATLRLVGADPSLRDSITMGKATLSWTRAAAALAPELAEADVVLTTDAMKALYYLGRVDYELHLDHLWEDVPPGGSPRPEWSLDTKLGVPLVSRPESVARILACHPRGLVVAQTGFLESDFVAPPETRALLVARTEPIELPALWGVTARRWRTAQPAGDCPPAPRKTPVDTTE